MKMIQRTVWMIMVIFWRDLRRRWSSGDDEDEKVRRVLAPTTSNVCYLYMLSFVSSVLRVIHAQPNFLLEEAARKWVVGRESPVASSFVGTAVRRKLGSIGAAEK